MPIRKGDGVSVVPNGIQEVRKGDGTVIYSAGPVIVDDFEDNDLVEYSNTTNFTTTTTAIEGSYSGQNDGTTTNDEQIYSMPGDGLPNYPSRGDTFEFKIADIGGLFAGMSFGLETGAVAVGDSTGYAARINERDTEIQLNRANGDGTSTNLATAAYTDTTDPYRGEVVYPATGNAIQYTLYNANGTELASVSAIDDTYSGGGIGWSRGGGTATTPRYDAARLL